MVLLCWQFMHDISCGLNKRPDSMCEAQQPTETICWLLGLDGKRLTVCRCCMFRDRENVKIRFVSLALIGEEHAVLS